MSKEPWGPENRPPNDVTKKDQSDAAARDQILSTISSFLDREGEPILHQEFDADGLNFETKRGKFFIPAYSFEIVNAHPELLTENDIDWKELANIDFYQRKRYFTGEITHGNETIHLFRKDSSTKTRETELQFGFPLQESRNSVHLGEGQPIAIDEHISFRVPKHYATAPHGVIMEYLTQKTVGQFIGSLDEQEAKKIIQAYKELFSFLAGDKYEAFAVPPQPLSKYQIGERMVYIESYDKDSGHIQFIITDLKNRFDKVPWDNEQK